MIREIDVLDAKDVSNAIYSSDNIEDMAYEIEGYIESVQIDIDRFVDVLSAYGIDVKTREYKNMMRNHQVMLQKYDFLKQSLKEAPNDIIKNIHESELRNLSLYVIRQELDLVYAGYTGRTITNLDDVKQKLKEERETKKERIRSTF